MLADVQAAGPSNSGDGAKDRLNIGHIAGADWVNHKVEFAPVEHGQLVHGSLHEAYVEAVLGGDRTIKRQHFAADVDDRYLRTAGRVQGTVPPAPSGKAENPLAANIAAEPPGGVHSRERMAQFLIASRSRERNAFAGKSVPSFGVVGDDRLVG